jgi:hypothetical protein
MISDQLEKIDQTVLYYQKRKAQSILGHPLFVPNIEKGEGVYLDNMQKDLVHRTVFAPFQL